MVVVVVADSTGCNGSASRLTRRTRLDLSTYRKHRERGGQETPTISYRLVYSFFFFLFATTAISTCFSVFLRSPFCARIGLGSETQDGRKKRQVEIERKVAGKSLRCDYDRLTLLSVGAFLFNSFLSCLFTDNIREVAPCALPLPSLSTLDAILLARVGSLLILALIATVLSTNII